MPRLQFFQMKRLFLIVIIWFSQIPIDSAAQSFGSYPPFTKWYENPLGISPISLHTSNGLLIPAVVAGALLLLTDRNSSVESGLTYYTEIGYSENYFGDPMTILQSNTGVLFPLRDYLDVGVELNVYHPFDQKNNTLGLGIRPFFNFYPYRSKNFSVFFESGAGIIYFFREYPQPTGFFNDQRLGTKWNGSPKYGIGVQYKATEALTLSAGLRHVHISNGDHPSDSRNPGHDSNGPTLRILWHLK